MTDPEIPTRQRSRRIRWTTILDPEELAVEIMNKLQKSRKAIDKMLAEHNVSFMQVQKETRQQFITDCEARIRALPDSVRSTVVAMLLSSEVFAVEMNFSELHISSEKSSLSRSCTDASLSDPSWKIRESAKFGGVTCALSGGCSNTDDEFHDKCLNNVLKTQPHPRQPESSHEQRDQAAKALLPAYRHQNSSKSGWVARRRWHYHRMARTATNS